MEWTQFYPWTMRWPEGGNVLETIGSYICNREQILGFSSAYQAGLWSHGIGSDLGTESLHVKRKVSVVETPGRLEANEKPSLTVRIGGRWRAEVWLKGVQSKMENKREIRGSSILTTTLKFYILIYFVCTCMRATAHEWRSEDKFLKWVLVFYLMGSKARTQVLKLDGRVLDRNQYLQRRKYKHEFHPLDEP